MAWYYNKEVKATFVNHTSMWAWASIEGLGWRRISSGSTDGVTNMAIAFAVAKANNRKVHVNIDTSNLITTMYLV